MNYISGENMNVNFLILLFHLLKNPGQPAEIRVLCAIGMGTLAIYTRINRLCSSRGFFSPHLSPAGNVNVRPR